MKTNHEDQMKLGSSKYANLHKWLNDNYKKRDTCDHCDFPANRIEWALKKGKRYSRNKDDYLNLCVPCHRKYDCTETQREKMRSVNIGNNNAGKRIIQMTVDGEYIKEFRSAAQAAKELGINRPNISNAATGKIKTAGGFTWRYRNVFKGDQGVLKEFDDLYCSLYRKKQKSNEMYFPHASARKILGQFVKEFSEQKDREWREKMIEVLDSMHLNNVFCCPRYIKGNCYCDALDRYKSHGKSDLLVRLKRWKQKQIKKLKDNQ